MFSSLLRVVEPVTQWLFVVDGLYNNLVILEQVFFLFRRRDLFKTQLAKFRIGFWQLLHCKEMYTLHPNEHSCVIVSKQIKEQVILHASPCPALAASGGQKS
jgi:hypothetical protein